MQTKLTLLFIFFALHLSAQDVFYEFANAQMTSSGGNDFYDVDILVSSTAGFKMGSGQLYFDYNPQAFGSSAFSNGLVTITTSGFLLGQTSGPFGIYTSFTANDNTPVRLSFSWQQALSSGCIPANNVSATAAALFHLQIQYISGGTAFAPNVCFASSGSFVDQTFTACGPDASCNFPDCGAEPGIQIFNDAFDCSNAPLPAELLSFDVQKEGETAVLLDWETATEQGVHYFEVERSINSQDWQSIGEVPAIGFSLSKQDYRFIDSDIQLSNRHYYYRLKTVDLDLSTAYSRVRSVTFSDPGLFSLYPNPTSWGVHLHFPTVKSDLSKATHVQVHSMEGQLIFEQNILQQDSHLVFPAFMESGVYLVSMRGEKGVLENVRRITLVRD